MGNRQLRYYIALGAPPTRDHARGDEAYMRPEIGFNPSWFHRFCQIDFSERWHQEPAYRLQAHEAMRAEVDRRFPGCEVGGANGQPPDLLTGLYGIAIVPAMFGQQIQYAPHLWPVPHGTPLTDEETDALTPVDVENNPFFGGILDQIEQIEQLTGSVGGFLNWQGPLNTAFRLRGEQIFLDIFDEPRRAQHLFECVTTTMIRGMKRLHERQNQSGVDYRFASVSNCVVNMIRPEHYAEHVLPFDLRIREAFEAFGIHNCAWVVDPYTDAYASVPNLGYIDMGLKSDLARAKRLFPVTRRNVLYTSMDLANQSEEKIRSDFERIARELAPCDVGLPDIEADVPDERVALAVRLCREWSRQAEGES